MNCKPLDKVLFFLKTVFEFFSCLLHGCHYLNIIYKQLSRYLY